MQANPISAKSLWENGWVFSLYGVAVGTAMAAMSSLDMNLSKAETLLMEPLSFYAFSALSLAGLIGLGVANLTVAPTAKAMHSSPWVTRFWVPIANAGLSTGAIITGMMFGVAIGIAPWSIGDADAMKIVKILLAMSGFVLAVLYPMIWMKRSLFDLTKEDEKRSVVTGLIYCLVLLFAFWQIDRHKFWYVIGTLGVASLSIGYLIFRQSRRRRSG